MKVLLSADLHGPPADHDLAERAEREGCSLVAIAGDLVDCMRFDVEEQSRATALWLREVAARVGHAAACSGNHDLDGDTGAAWLTRAAADPATAGRLTVDGGHAVLAGLVVSAVPFWNILEHGAKHHAFLRARVEQMWAEGRALATARALPWLVLHHEPPSGLKVSVTQEESAFYDVDTPPLGWCRHWIGVYRPDYVLSGHLHTAPLTPGGSWIDLVRETGTWCFNPGRREKACALIELDTVRRQAHWFPSWSARAFLTRSLDAAASAAA